jgi:NADPH:quinone reductase-like Zn-dependent oxidoreductase
MPTVYVTVLRALRDKANIQRGQTLLVHSAAGGVGIAALYYAQWIGAEIYTTVSSEEKASFLAKSFGIPRENIFHSRDSSFVDQILASTRGRGVDVVLNSLSGELLHASWRCVAADGCMVEIGKRDIVGRGRLAMDPFLANRSFIGVDVATIPTTNIDTVKKLLNTTIELYENGVFQPIQPITRFEADHVEDALRYLQRGKHIGKVVVNFPEKLELPLAPTVPAFALRSDKTYLLVGGMGGIGMAIARWIKPLSLN